MLFNYCENFEELQKNKKKYGQGELNVVIFYIVIHTIYIYK